MHADTREGSAFENMPLVSNKEIMAMREKCGETLTQMMHCRQCRADAVGDWITMNPRAFAAAANAAKPRRKQLRLPKSR
jgi:hypothetical protein